MRFMPSRLPRRAGQLSANVIVFRFSEHKGKRLVEKREVSLGSSCFREKVTFVLVRRNQADRRRFTTAGSRKCSALQSNDRRICTIDVSVPRMTIALGVISEVLRSTRFQK